MSLQESDFDNAKLDLVTISEVANVNYTDDTTFNREGEEIDTATGRLKKIGFIPPVAYGVGIGFLVTDNFKTIDRLGIVYAPLPTELPFTTTGTWVADDENKFFVVQGTVIADQSITPTKLAGIGDAFIYIGVGASTVAAVSVTGAIAIDNAGLTVLNNGVVGNDNVILDSIDGDKLADGTVPEAKLEAAFISKVQVVPGTLNGVETSINVAEPLTDIDVASGFLADSTGTTYITVPASTIEIDNDINVGNGGFPTALTLTQNTFYRVFICAETGGTNPKAVFDTSNVATNALADLAGTYTLFKQIAWVKTKFASTDIEFYVQDGDDFYWDVPFQDRNAVPTVGLATPFTLTVPNNTIAKINVAMTGSGFQGAGPNYAYITRASQSDLTPSVTATHLNSFNNGNVVWDQSIEMDILADGSSQIKERALSTTATLRVLTYGFTYKR